MSPRLLPIGKLPGDGLPAPALSVAIPVLDGGQRLMELLAALAEQETDGPVEILLADSGSSDGVPARAQERWPELLLFRVEGSYDHGLVRSALVAQARAPLVALLSQDAIPQGHDYLETLAASFAEPEVAGAYARQLPRSGAEVPFAKQFVGLLAVESESGRPKVNDFRMFKLMEIRHDSSRVLFFTYFGFTLGIFGNPARLFDKSPGTTFQRNFGNPARLQQGRHGKLCRWKRVGPSTVATPPLRSRPTSPSSV